MTATRREDPFPHQIDPQAAFRGLILISAMYLLVLIVSFGVQYVQVRVMQRVGQDTQVEASHG